MQVVIIEDELAASNNLKRQLANIDSTIEVLAVLDSVKQSVDYFLSTPKVDLIFMDIHLADGISFEIFDQVQLNVPVIFTTAFDQYTLKAFKVNSIDYLLKPIIEEELEAAIHQFKNQSEDSGSNVADTVQQLLAQLDKNQEVYKSSYLLSHRDELVPVKVSDIAFFYIDTGVVRAATFENKKYVLDKKLEDLEKELDPRIFDRANRQFVVNKNAIKTIKKYFGGKLIIQTVPVAPERIVVSKAKAPIIKQWLNT
ncbi:LytTR family DNA-binding domain-containing protein [Spongiivirga sp. MCCC 1A20706]|uniref:LytR/AlgR family response regulator transcription factor n=1 Tax=Spongiivirga sp. MCCC 1A20706 TaxID=3160963 RepID=UPI003977D1EA